MSLYVRAPEAARRLGVSRPTLYAYVSRGLIARRTAADGRSSLYAVDDIERLRTRSRASPAPPRPTIDVQIASAVTRLDEDALLYRGHPVLELAGTASFEEVAELLWTGELPPATPRWPHPEPDDVARARAADAALPAGAGPLTRLLATATAVGSARPDDTPAGAARRLLGLAPVVTATVAARSGRAGRAPQRGTVADRLTRAWHPRPGPALRAAVDTALVLLADHELATSTLAVRVAASVRADAWAALAAGLATATGRLHGAAAAAAHGMLDEAEATGAARAVATRLDARQRLPGFGHSVYRTGDPRLPPLLDAVRGLPDRAGRLAVVDEVLAVAGSCVDVHPNVDLGLGALTFVAGLDPDVPLFAVARLAGWAAHAAEEADARPVRFRGLAVTP